MSPEACRALAREVVLRPVLRAALWCAWRVVPRAAAWGEILTGEVSRR